MPENCDLLLRRNFAVLKLDDGAGWNRDGALRVSFVAEGLAQPLDFVLPARAAP